MGRDSIKVYQNKNIHDDSFILDESIFIDCQLKNCDLFYSGGDTEWANTKFENCRFHWRGPAKNMFALLQMIGLLPIQLSAPAPPNSTTTKPPN
jgi:hypothetical protein